MNVAIFTFLFALVRSTEEQCKVHTQFYESWNYKIEQDPNFFFLPRTFNTTNPCAQFNVTQPSDGTFWCMDYIIGEKNDDLASYNCRKNIRGNVIIMRSEWNEQMKQLCLNYADLEKYEIYKDIFTKAYQNVLNCCNTEAIPTTTVINGPPVIEPTQNGILPIVILGIVCYGLTGCTFILMLFIAIYGCIKRHDNTEEHSEV